MANRDGDNREEEEDNRHREEDLANQHREGEDSKHREEDGDNRHREEEINLDSRHHAQDTTTLQTEILGFEVKAILLIRLNCNCPYVNNVKCK